MNNLNSIIIEGNLIKDPEFNYTSAKNAICKFTIVVNNKQDKEYKDNKYLKDISYFDVIAQSKLAEMCNKYFIKGNYVRIVGKLRQDKEKDREGNIYFKVNIIAKQIELQKKI